VNARNYSDLYARHFPGPTVASRRAVADGRRRLLSAFRIPQSSSFIIHTFLVLRLASTSALKFEAIEKKGKIKKPSATGVAAII
jgi:hypothetical protein